MTGRLRRLLPADLRGQVAGILFIGLALSQLLAAVLYVVLLPKWQRVLRPDAAVARIEMVVRLLESVDPAQRPPFARLSSDEDFMLSYDASAAPPADRAAGDSRYAALRAQLASKLQRSGANVWVGPAAGRKLLDATHIRVGLRGGGALDVIASVGLEHRLGLVAQAGLGAFLVFATVGLWVWLTLMVNVPLSRVARAAERVGLDVNAPLLAEQGPAQLQRVIRAFNDMQGRLQRLLADRTLMLGAISHDLRTPLTRLRLRVETGRAVAERQKMLGDIESMENMVASALSFVRGVDDAEAHDAVDLALLLQTACDMVSDLGGEVELLGAERCRYDCKPQAMLRALTNVIMNASRYGQRARVTLTARAGTGFVVEVADDGPGIPDEEKARVFEPFYRSRTAHDADSHGMGLGLTIARSVILGHGGTIELLDRAPHGLLVQIVLPRGAA